MAQWLDVVGRGHSGSTVLDAMLANAQGIESVGELVTGMGRCDDLCRLESRPENQAYVLSDAGVPAFGTRSEVCLDCMEGVLRSIEHRERPMQWCVTGSSGYIGSRLVTTLQELGHEVTGIDRRPASSSAPNRFIQADLLEASELACVLAGADTVFHLAAAKDDWGLTAEEYYRDNVHATRALIDAGREAGVTNWIFYSTVAVLGASREPLDETAPATPVIPYGASKAEAETLFHELAADDRHARVLIMRPSAVYGPGAPPNTNIYRLIEAVYRNRFVTIGNGRALKTTSYLDNLLAATLFAMEHMDQGVQTFIYVDEPVLTTNELVERAYHLLGRSRPTRRVPLWLAWPIAHVADAAAAALKVDLPITAARIRKIGRAHV